MCVEDVESMPCTRSKNAPTRPRSRQRSDLLDCPLSPVQKLASAFLYISQIWGYLIGNMQKRSGFSSRSGSGSRVLLRGLVNSCDLVRPLALPGDGAGTGSGRFEVMAPSTPRTGDSFAICVGLLLLSCCGCCWGWDGWRGVG